MRKSPVFFDLMELSAMKMACNSAEKIVECFGIEAVRELVPKQQAEPTPSEFFAPSVYTWMKLENLDDIISLKD